MKSLINIIKKNIENNNLTEAIKLIKELELNENDAKEISLIFARLNEIDQQERTGVINRDDSSRRRSQIRSDLLQLANKIEREYVEKVKKNGKIRKQTVHFNKWLAIPILILLLITLIFTFVFKFQKRENLTFNVKKIMELQDLSLDEKRQILFDEGFKRLNSGIDSESFIKGISKDDKLWKELFQLDYNGGVKYLFLKENFHDNLYSQLEKLKFQHVGGESYQNRGYFEIYENKRFSVSLGMFEIKEKRIYAIRVSNDFQQFKSKEVKHVSRSLIYGPWERLEFYPGKYFFWEDSTFQFSDKYFGVIRGKWTVNESKLFLDYESKQMLHNISHPFNRKFEIIKIDSYNSDEMSGTVESWDKNLNQNIKLIKIK